MGWASKLNPRSPDGKSERQAINALLTRFGESFATRQEYEAACDLAGVTDEERCYMESLLPAHLTYSAVKIHTES